MPAVRTSTIECGGVSPIDRLPHSAGQHASNPADGACSTLLCALSLFELTLASPGPVLPPPALIRVETPGESGRQPH